MAEHAALIVKTVKTVCRAHPKTSVIIAIKSGYRIAAKGCRIIWLMKIRSKVVAVKTVQAIFGGYPYISIPVLADIGNLAV